MQHIPLDPHWRSSAPGYQEPDSVAVIHQAKGIVMLPDGTRVDLSRRLTLWRIFLAMGRAAQASRAMDVDDVFMAGWNGERALPAAIRNRVYVAVSTLRRYGLSGVLQTSPDGYRLSPEIKWVFDEMAPQNDQMPTGEFALASR
ncbi:MAG: hypothetical protein KJO07_24065 [Deltaproteobacteria bacterium]|nr:hypothetical protein [Deltaproteobacteria bacterium]